MPTIIKSLFLLSALVIISLVVDWPMMTELLSEIHLGFFAIVVLIALLDQVVMGAKWQLLLKGFGVTIPLTAPVMAYLRGRIFTLVTPSTIGIDAYKAYYLKKYYNAKLAPVASSIAVERILGAISSLAIITLLLKFSSAPLGLNIDNWLWPLSVGGYLAICGGVYIIIHFAKALDKITMPSRMPEKFRTLSHQILANLALLKQGQSYAWGFFFASIAEKIFYGSAIYFSLLAIGITKVDFMFIIAATPLMALLERLPISISSIGVREGLYVAMLAPFYSDPTIPLAMALVLRAAEIAQIALLGGVWLRQPEANNFEQDLAQVEAKIHPLADNQR